MNCPEGLTLRSTDVAAPESRAKIDNAKDVAAKIRMILMFTTGCGQNSCAKHAVASTIANFLSKKGETLSPFQRLIFRTKNRLMNTKRILSSVVAATMLTASVAIAAHGNDQARSKTKVRAAKQTTTMTTRGKAAVRTRSFATRSNAAVRTRSFVTGGNTATVRTRTARDRSTVFVGGSGYGYSYPYSSYGYGYGYPYYSYGPSVSFGFGYPYS